MKMDTMTPERFIDLAEAFGGDIDRWPTEAQAPARDRLERDPHLALVLGEAGAVDAFLASSPEPAFSGVLRERLVAGAPRRSALTDARRWIAGAGLAAACAVGVVFGAQFSDRLIGSPTSVATSADAASPATTSFDGGQTDILGLEDEG